MNKKHRIFIAINLPEDIKKKLGEEQEKWPELPVRWTKKDNLHITLFFLGYLNDEEILETCNLVKEAVSKHSSFLIRLNKICYGPVDRTPPRMIWAIGEKSSQFASLRGDLNKTLMGSNNLRYSSEKREFFPHITLGRIRAFEWRRIEPEERPEVDEDIDLKFEVNSLEVMESVLKRGGPEYTVLESYNLI